MSGYNLEFKLFLEGVETPFKSASITCVPTGTVANINIYANKLANDLIPKTAVQIFFKEWAGKTKGSWRIMFDGYFSKVINQEASTEGRMMGVECRDSMTDVNNIPAALVYQSLDSLGNNKNAFMLSGIHQSTSTKGANGKQNKQDTRVYNSGKHSLIDLSEQLYYIAGSSQGGKSHKKNGETVYTGKFDKCFKYKDGKSNGGLFLDSFARGLWMESIGGTNVAAFLNKRIRVEKKMFIPVNETGYRLWSEQKSSTQIGSYLMGNAKFSSVMAAIMRVSGLFSTRPFTCSTPRAIPVDSKSTAAEYVMDPRTREFMVDELHEEYGGKFVLNQMMLLPALEFTAPPSCNILLPPMYDNLSWEYDYDTDATRGNYKQADLFGSAGSSGLGAMSIQVPNAIFDKHGTDSKGRRKLPITLEERYKGIITSRGQVAYKLGLDDAYAAFKDSYLNAKAGSNLEAKIKELEKELKDTVVVGAETGLKNKDIKARLAEKRRAKNKDINRRQTNAVQRHALIKFMNARYGRRVMQVGMMFNPYIMAGFPTLIVAKDYDNKSGASEISDITGQVQTVRHDITIGPGGGDATTGVVINGARFVNHPTDMDKDGNPIWSKATDTISAKLGDDMKFDKPHYVNDSKPRVEYDDGAYMENVTYFDKEYEVYDNKEKYEAELKKRNQAAYDEATAGVDQVQARKEWWNSNNNKEGYQVKDDDGTYNPEKSKYQRDKGFFYHQKGVRQRLESKQIAYSDAEQKAIDDDYERRLRAGIPASKVEVAAEPITVISQQTWYVRHGEQLTKDNGGITVLGKDRDAAYLEFKRAKEAEHLEAIIKKNAKVYVNPMIKTTKIKKTKMVKKYKYTPYDLVVTGKDETNGYLYAKDFLTLTSADVASGETNLQYLDDIYLPNQIHKFYHDVFGIDEKLMVGESFDSSGPYQFAYDTIHEAVVNFKKNNQGAIKNYDEAISLVRRDICSADVFYGGVMGASVLRWDDQGNQMYNDDGTPMHWIKLDTDSVYDHTEIRSKYYGLSDWKYSLAEDGVKKENGGLIDGPGDFSSILENIPLSPFIKERRIAVERYISSIVNQSTHKGQYE